MPATVSVVIPCYNEQGNIRLLLEAIHAQTYPRVALEVVIADGLSEDRTRAEIAAFVEAHADLPVIVVDNPRRITPAGLNLAIGRAGGEIIVRLDGHSLPRPDYVERCVADLEAGLGESVGGVWEIRPGRAGWMAESIAAAAAHPLGVGDALYRHSGKAGYVDTVPFGAFKRELLALVGFFDESLASNEDYEFNVRVRKAGGRIWLDPAIRSTYLARAGLAALARQYARYGYWKWRMLRRHPDSLRWRQALPPLFVAAVLVGGLLSLIWVGFGYALAASLLVYLAALLAAGAQAAGKERKSFLLAGVPAAIATMHLAWGSGFIWSMIEGVFQRGTTTRP
jgi:glycosyltransferase involved in cell wall biosynthesis